jgi:hypothetical protein
MVEPGVFLLETYSVGWLSCWSMMSLVSLVLVLVLVQAVPRYGSQPTLNSSGIVVLNYSGMWY